MTADGFATELALDLYGDLLAALGPRPAWHADAASAASTPNWPGTPSRGQSTRKAKALSATCLVAEECLADALAAPAPEDHGIRGGTSPQERARMRRERAA